ncbi:hypothetical protein [Pseudomonas protegens]|uniref:hypothetical protein n=1 Tax=Pseudomonas protegens TaxID=380021 RepID=UPI00301C3132
MDLELLKQAIKMWLKTPGWEPTAAELAEIQQLIEERRPTTNEALAQIIDEVIEWRRCWSMEGLDMSDLNALLLMAAQPPRNDK